MSTYRLAFGRFMCETNSFSSVETTRADFERTHWMEGQELLQACQPHQWEAKGFLRNLELSGFVKALAPHAAEVELIPLLSAWSISGGPVARQDFEDACQQFKTQLQAAGHLDGVFLALHGAMGVTGLLDPEAYLLTQIREVVGDIPVMVSMDLHAVLTQEKVTLVNALCAYHSNPHWDMAKTGQRSGELLWKTVSGQVKPTTAWRSLPMILGGGKTIDFLPPMRAIFQHIKRLCKDPRVLDASVFMCHPFLNHPELGWSVYVVTDNQPELAEAMAEDLAWRCWEVRHEMPPEFLSVPDLLTEIRQSRLARKLGSIAVCDASDVVGAGGTGENTALLKVFLNEAPELSALIPLRDPVIVAQLWSESSGNQVTVSVGGKLQPEFNPAVTVTGKVLSTHQTDNFGKVVVLDLGKVKLVLTEGYAMPLKPSFYEDLGLSTWQPDVVIVKNFFHFRLYFLARSRRFLYVKTRGITDFERILDVPTHHPVYPRDAVADWRPTDRIRRGVPEERQAVLA